MSTAAVIGQDIHDVDPASLENSPSARMVPRTSGSISMAKGSGVLTERGGGWFYKRNESALTRDAATEEYTARFAPVEQVARIPDGSPLTGAMGSFSIWPAMGRWMWWSSSDRWPASMNEPMSRIGNPFRAFRSIPNLAWNDPNLKFIDLTGDGHADVLITEEQAFTWYPSLAEEGFGAANRLSVPTDEERGRMSCLPTAPRRYRLPTCRETATDIVRIRNGDVCYWPNSAMAASAPK